MLTLTLLRHAKSSWADQAMDDHERPLNARGQRDARELARSLSSTLISIPGASRVSGLQPPLRVLCSTAIRTRQTLAALRQVNSLEDDAVTFDESLYLATPARIAELVEAAKSDHLLVIGHNPGMESLASGLAGHSLTMKTSSFCHFERVAVQDVWRFVEQQTPRA